ncbi:MAG TPA: FAD-dependent oxidoreductase [Galbitalea sp.]|nr:FAD-dependent oxidoreductase [Galbitalea sp.]
MAERHDFLVVGGGVAGLVLARRLALGGRSVVVLEAADHVGGAVARHTVGGLELDAGAESFATRNGTVSTLATALGLGDDIVKPNPEGAWLQPASGSAFRLPQNSLLGIPGSPLATDVTAIIGMRAGIRAFSEALLPGTVGAKSATLGELVRRRMGRTVLDQLVRPIVRGVHSADADDLPLDQVAPGLRHALLRDGSLARAVLDLRETSARAGSAVAGIRGGVFRIVDQLLFDLERFGVDVRLRSRATRIGPDSLTAGTARMHGRVVVAAPGLIAASPDKPTRVILATLIVDQPLLDGAPRGTGVLVADGAPDIRARALTHSTAKWPWLAQLTGGRHVLRLSYDESTDELAEVARTDASALLGVPLPKSAVLDFDRHEWYRPSRVTGTPDGVSLAGESIAGTGLASVIAHSEALAGTLLTDFEG